MRQFFSGQFLTAGVVMMGVPLSWICMVGSLRNRLVNGLTLLTVYIYLVLGLRFEIWDNASYLLLLTPYISLLIKPKRSMIKYLTVGFTTVYLIFGLISGNQMAGWIKAMSIIAIYLVFLPPVIRSTLNQMKERIKPQRM